MTECVLSRERICHDDAYNRRDFLRRESGELLDIHSLSDSGSAGIGSRRLKEGEGANCRHHQATIVLFQI
jgi:hypothetical protein